MSQYVFKLRNKIELLKEILNSFNKILFSTSNPEFKKKKKIQTSQLENMHTLLFLDLAQSRHPVSCMIPLSGIWLSLSILIFSLRHPRCCRRDRPAGETTPSGAVLPTRAPSKWNDFCKAFFYRYIKINYFL